MLHRICTIIILRVVFLDRGNKNELISNADPRICFNQFLFIQYSYGKIINWVLFGDSYIGKDTKPYTAKKFYLNLTEIPIRHSAR